jgi:CHASE2 domain-containing sensor protein
VSATSRVGFWRGFARAHRTFVPVALLVLAAHYAGWLQRVQFLEHDVLQTSQLFSRPTSTYVVGVTDTDHGKYFDGGDLSKKPAIIHELVQAALDGGARAVGVAIDTSTMRASGTMRDGPVVWGYHLAAMLSEPRSAACPVDRPMRQAMAVHGGDVLPAGNRSGVSDLIAVGAKTRAYEPVAMATLPASAGATRNQPQVHMGRAVADLVLGQARPQAVTAAQDIRFVADCSGVRFMSAGQVLETHKQARWGRDKPFANAAVLIGATFLDSGDVHETPVGPMYGVQVLANVVETELAGPLLASKWPALLLEYAAAFLYYMTLRWASPRRAIWIGGLLIPAASLMLALVLFDYGFVFVSSVGVLLSIYVEQIAHLVATAGNPPASSQVTAGAHP